jgi:Cu+-exporting ATPase
LNWCNLEKYDFNLHILIGSNELKKKEVIFMMMKDCVCGMELDDKKAGSSFNYKGKTYHFCSDECRDKFEKSPEKFQNCM